LWKHHVNLCGVSTNKTIICFIAMQTYKELNINTICICQFRCGRTNSTQKMRYEDILGHTSDTTKCKWFTMSWKRQNIETECLKNDQNTCLETLDTTPNARLRYPSLSEDIPLLLALSVCKIRSRNVLTIERDAILTMWQYITTVVHNIFNQENCHKRFVFLPKPIKIRI
jgi:hypothetical protein